MAGQKPVRRRMSKVGVGRTGTLTPVSRAAAASFSKSNDRRHGLLGRQQAGSVQTGSGLHVCCLLYKCSYWNVND